MSKRDNSLYLVDLEIVWDLIKNELDNLKQKINELLNYH